MFIRHAVTQFNIEFAKILNENGLVSDAMRELSSNPLMMDGGLRDEGFE